VIPHKDVSVFTALYSLTLTNISLAPSVVYQQTHTCLSTNISPVHCGNAFKWLCTICL